MKTRTFGKTGVSVSEIGLGAWQIGGSWGEVSEETALETLAAALATGVTFIDTADVYGGGRSESLIGRFLSQRSDDVFVATKIGRFPEPGGTDNFTEATFRAHTEASLRRLRREALDLTQLHCIPTVLLERGEVFEWLRRLQQDGKIRHFGVSVESMDEALMCLEVDGVTSLQIIFNIFRPKPISTLFEKAKARGVALIVRLPLASGLLAGKLSADSTFPDNDHRHFNRNGQVFSIGETFAGLTFERGLALVDEVARILPGKAPMAAEAIRWILDHDAVSVVIPGAKNPRQATENAAASDLPPLPAEVHAALMRLYEEKVAAHIRGVY